MPDPRRVELEDLVNRPGTYFNPQTEVLIVVDDSPEMDAEIFNMEDLEGADWVHISDDVPVDEAERDRLLEQFQIHYHAGNLESNEDDAEEDEEEEEDEDEFDEDDQEPEREDQ